MRRHDDTGGAFVVLEVFVRASGWRFLVLLVCCVPLAVGIATKQSWPPYVTYASWGLFVLVAVIRSLRRKTRHSAAEGVVGAGDTYNELFMARPNIPVTFGPDDAVVAEEQGARHDDITDGKVTLHIPDDK